MTPDEKEKIIAKRKRLAHELFLMIRRESPRDATAAIADCLIVHTAAMCDVCDLDFDSTMTDIMKVLKKDAISMSEKFKKFKNSK